MTTKDLQAKHRNLEQEFDAAEHEVKAAKDALTAANTRYNVAVLHRDSLDRQLDKLEEEIVDRELA